MKDGIKLYGPSRGLASWSRVTAGIAQGLEQCGVFAGRCVTDELSHEIDQRLEPGFDAPRAIYVGPPGVANAMLRGFHGERLAMIAANSSWLPDVELRDLVTQKAVTGFLAPSEWSKRVIGSYDLGVPTFLYEHGVDDAFRPSGLDSFAPKKSFRALHLASTANDRKGTGALVRAWVHLVQRGEIPKDSELVVVVDGPDDAISRHVDGGKGVRIERVTRLDFPPLAMAAWYQGYHVVIQPSRAEGFGLVPLEARASGVPVIMTNGTGHDQHLPAPPSRQVTFRGGVPVGFARTMLRTHQGLIVVPVTEDLSLIDDGPGALAPTFREDALMNAIAVAYQLRDKLRAGARESAECVREYWSWQAVTERFLRVVSTG